MYFCLSLILTLRDKSSSGQGDEQEAVCRWRSGWASVSRLLEEGQEFPWEEDSLVRAACEQHRRLRRARLQCSATERGEEAPLRQAGSRFPALHSSSLYFGSVCSQDVHPVPARHSRAYGSKVSVCLPSGLPYHRSLTPVQATLHEGLGRLEEEPHCSSCEVTLGNTTAVQQ